NFSTVGQNLRHIIVGLSARLILVPAVFLFVAAYVFGFRGADLAILIAVFATPSAVSSFTMAQQMGGDHELAGQLVMFGTVTSVLTIFLWIFTAMQLSLI
ncbi:MAG: AEC family transporter, partial [Ruminococcaceae bacterium]|nr:AEC family transporter [Oscillospiraceae bacterium]